MIDKFDGYYSFLSNFYFSTVYYSGIAFPTVEHAYQASKTMDQRQRIYISKIPWNKAGQAKRFGRKITLRWNWDLMKIEIMEDLIHQKFQKTKLREKLLETGNEILVEGNYWHDNFWGNCKCQKCINITGENRLGIILMQTREII